MIFFTKLSVTLSQDLKILGYFNIEGYKFTDDDIKKINKNVATQLILIIEQMKRKHWCEN
jgi:hypothetical protein